MMVLFVVKLKYSMKLVDSNNHVNISKKKFGASFIQESFKVDLFFKTAN